MMTFSGIWVPLVTPFCDGRLDLPALRRLVQHLAGRGVAGFVACGSTGEAAMLDEAEQDQVLATTLAAAAGLPVLMGLAGVRADLLAVRARRLAAEHAVSGLLLSAPAYMKPSQAGLLAHFRSVADASPLPIVAYDIPARTGVRIELPTLLALAAHPRIQAVKDCSSDAAAATAVLGDGRLALLAGNDDEMFAQMALGATGAIAASAHLRADLFVQLHRLLQQQRLHEAQALWRALRPLAQALFAEPNPMVVKAVLAQQGWLRNELRAPMQPADVATTARVLSVLEGLARDWPPRPAEDPAARSGTPAQAVVAS
ncbi:4-hydroxy-tetrahydrodipicolinate synthase family protein [Aquabacterium sp.]|uniref:4-hydroxy-tetrahydrodipicolinate synthase family protein n=1 Tax=Aquabacterium sp. TaxID=1872578 RepID=UPI002C6AF346|nr:4-hydroxy-tetrahydrodipicolinate synthase [Aquabacterium sp.]HSW07709.1 4-hydroxy-tetrahydrodipicolinate synthase [Aquabacterium sp.]